MSDPHASRPGPAAGRPLTPARLALQTCLLGCLGTGLLLAAVLPFLGGGRFPETGWPQLWGGVCWAVVSSCLGCSVLAVGAYRRPEDPRNSSGFLRAVVLDFALQVGAMAGGILVLYLAAVKFPGLAVFGIAFAVVAMVFRMLGTWLISRALSTRYRQQVRAAGEKERLDQDTHS